MHYTVLNNKENVKNRSRRPEGVPSRAGQEGADGMKRIWLRIGAAFAGLFAAAAIGLSHPSAVSAASYGSAANATELNPRNYGTCAASLRDAMVKRDTAVRIFVKVPYSDYGNNKLARSILDRAMEENYAGNAGDYLLYSSKSFSYGFGQALNFDFSGSELAIITTLEYDIGYRDDASKESQTASGVNSRLKSLNLSGKSDYDRVSSIYNYITTNVTYDTKAATTSNGDTVYKTAWTAYGAYCNKKAVCQGYALLFYKMCNLAGVRARIVDGDARGARGNEGHAWNMVRIGNSWYYCDPTWDAAYKQAGQPYQYFLKNTSDFKDHYLDTSSTTGGNGTRNKAILSACPLSSKSYGQGGSKYKVTVSGGKINGGSSSGSFKAGTVIEIKASSPPLAGQVFSRWSGTAAYASGSATSSTVKVKVSGDISLKATYAYRDANVKAANYKVSSLSAPGKKNSLKANKNSKKDNTSIVLEKSASAPRFKLSKAGSGYYYLMNVKSKKYLSLKGSSAVQGKKGTSTSRWRIVKDGKAYRLINKNGKALTVSGSTVRAGADSGSKKQKFKLPK